MKFEQKIRLIQVGLVTKIFYEVLARSALNDFAVVSKVITTGEFTIVEIAAIKVTFIEITDGGGRSGVWVKSGIIVIRIIEYFSVTELWDIIGG